MIILGYFLAIVMGLVLGLLGGGGSILTVPILVYVVKLDPVYATAYSLFVVGLASLIGAYKYSKKSLLNYKVGVLFSVPAFVGVYLVRRYLIPWMPENMSLMGYSMSKGHLILLVFSVVMILASYFMIRGRKDSAGDVGTQSKIDLKLVVLEGLIVGAVTGFVGAGGGFLIVPALVLLAKLPMKEAVGTSLAIISVKSLLGFTGDMQTLESIDWVFLTFFSGLSIVGILIGSYFAERVPAAKLKKAFGWFVLIMGIFILLKQI